MVEKFDLQTSSIEDDKRDKELKEELNYIIEIIKNEKPFRNMEEEIIKDLKVFAEKKENDTMEKLKSISREIELLMNLKTQLYECLQNASSTKEDINNIMGKATASLEQIRLILRGGEVYRDDAPKKCQPHINEMGDDTVQ